MFGIYLQLGFDHILDLNAYDHILFVMTLCAIYVLADWKKVLWLVTAFTVGHSLTLALSVFSLVSIPASLIEKLIPITIMVTALSNVFWKAEGSNRMRWLYAMAGFFGLIHGLGFSNYLKALLGGEEDLLLPLFAFNLGVEGGQILIVAMAMAINFVWTRWLGLNNYIWIRIVSFLAFWVAFYLLFKQL